MLQEGDEVSFDAFLVDGEDPVDPAHGTAVAGANGTVTDTPDAGHTGTDTFDYVVTDGTRGPGHHHHGCAA